MSEGPGNSGLADRVDSALAALWRGEVEELSRLVDGGANSGAWGLGPILRAVGVEGGIGPDVAPGGRLGEYEIIRELGRGGMGVVYEARQRHPDRRVALKVIKGEGSSDALRIKLFEREVQTLARLRHPGIAAIYSAGQADAGQHFFAMELVHGDTLLEYANASGASRLGGPLDIGERLRLFCGICDAVNYAHQRGVIHRDLKPSNILVSDRPGSSAAAGSGALGAELKVLDFGLARITDADVEQTTLITETGKIVGTLAYMSPEQARGDADAIDLRSDVYSLAVILYELLTGQLPYELSRAMPHQALRTICESPPRRPSTVNRALRGDLETIALKGLAKDPSQRYQSAAVLGDDIRRYLAGQPIVARPPSAVYQLRKLVARHKAPAALIALLFVSVVAFAVVATVQSRRVADERDKAVLAQESERAARTDAERARDAAETEAEKAQRIQTFLQDMLASVDPARAQGRDVGLLRDLLGDAARRVEHELAAEPEVAAAVRSTVGRTYVGLGLYDEARPHLEAALAFSEREYGADDLRVAAALDDMGTLYVRSADFAAAEPYLQRALDIRRRVLGEEHVDLATSYVRLGRLYGFRNEYDRSEELLRQAVALRRAALGPDDLLTARAVGELAWLLARRETLDGAEELHREAVEMLTRILGEEHPDTAMATANLASVVKKLGRLKEAEEIHARALALHRRVLGDDHPLLAEGLVEHADLLKRLGRFDEAEALLQDAVRIQATHLGKDNDFYASAISHLGSVKIAQGDYAAGEALYREALEIYRTVNGERHLSVVICQSNLGTLLVRAGKYADAETVFRDALALLLDLYGETHPGVTIIQTNLAETLAKLGKLEEAEALQRAVLAARRAVYGDEHPRVATVLANLAGVLHARGAYAEAEDDYRAALAIMRATQGEKHPLVGSTLCELGMLLADADQPAEAAAAFSEAFAVHAAAYPDGHPERAKCLKQFGRFLLVHDELVEVAVAEAALRSYRALVEVDEPGEAGLLAAIDSALGGCLSRAGRHEEAGPLLTDTLPAIREQYGVDGAETIRAIQRIVAHYEALGETAQAAEYRGLLPGAGE